MLSPPVKEALSVEQKISEGDPESLEDVARKVECHVHKARAAILEEFGKTFLSGIYL